ncbi:peptidase associated/transthyretin-like domain-containing protein [Pseudomonas rhizosphaerae]|jgi:hypothetical protein|uniref:hypothetical protein n=1 Tax=Pseudomonas rhizosphaerae TaxID=216142 RepID=UPI0017801F59|nr:hypothetical protein [Pseudomonas rhizosphaerae]MBD8613808.1 hypothetical protein [Pseudomonas putida]MEB2870293.1 hypothetical protein [Pseudomonas rhizosphaerae]
MNVGSVVRIAAVFVMLVLQGCASILGDSRYPVSVSSAPPGASFEIADKNGQIVHSGHTPSTVTLKSGKGYFSGQTYTLRFKKDGYPDRSVTLDSSVSGWYWGNIVFGGLIGMLIVDPATGAMYKLPDFVSADMGVPIAERGGLSVGMIDSLTASQRADLIPLRP